MAHSLFRRSLGIAIVLAAAVSLFAEQPGESIPLWPNGVPNGGTNTDAEQLEGPDHDQLTHVHNPSILVFLPAKETATGVGVVVAPGGAHRFLSMKNEGYEIAKYLNSLGIAAFILKYRLAQSPDAHYTVEEDALNDAKRALRIVRSRAADWNLQPDKIGIMGFSAGGYVAALAETRFDSGNSSSSDPVERVSSRPDFAIVVYPGFKIENITVPKDAPPTFLVCADDDRSHVVVTTKLYLLLEDAKIPSELHIYATGGHGFGMRDKHAPVSTWNQRMVEWMRDRGILRPAS